MRNKYSTKLTLLANATKRRLFKRKMCPFQWDVSFRVNSKIWHISKEMFVNKIVYLLTNEKNERAKEKLPLTKIVWQKINLYILKRSDYPE